MIRKVEFYTENYRLSNKIKAIRSVLNGGPPVSSKTRLNSFKWNLTVISNDYHSVYLKVSFFAQTADRDRIERES